MMARQPLGVLIVDDNEHDFRATRDLFNRAGGAPFTVVWASSYADGLAAIVEGECDVCLVDYDLDGRSGLELVREAQERGASAPMILLSGYHTGAVAEEHDLAGVDDCLPKWHLSAALLERSVRHAVERREHAIALREAQRRLAASSRIETLGRVVSGVAHDFNNMLTAIICEAEHMKATLSPDDPRHTSAEAIIGSSARAAGLTRQLLRIGCQRNADFREIDVNDVVEGVQSLLQRLLGTRVTVVMELIGDTGLVLADVAQLERVLVNFALNARDAMPDGGQVIIGTRPVCLESIPDGARLEPGEYVVMSVTDEGTGMSHEIKEQIFEPFFTTKGPDEGTGVGLSSVRDLVERMGGAVLVHSELGIGSTFEAYLPLAR